MLFYKVDVSYYKGEGVASLPFSHCKGRKNVLQLGCKVCFRGYDAESCH